MASPFLFQMHHIFPVGIFDDPIIQEGLGNLLPDQAVTFFQDAKGNTIALFTDPQTAALVQTAILNGGENNPFSQAGFGGASHLGSHPAYSTFARLTLRDILTNPTLSDTQKTDAIFGLHRFLKDVSNGTVAHDGTPVTVKGADTEANSQLYKDAWVARQAEPDFHAQNNAYKSGFNGTQVDTNTSFNTQATLDVVDKFLAVAAQEGLLPAERIEHFQDIVDNVRGSIDNGSNAHGGTIKQVFIAASYEIANNPNNSVDIGNTNTFGAQLSYAWAQATLFAVDESGALYVGDFDKAMATISNISNMLGQSVGSLPNNLGALGPDALASLVSTFDSIIVGVGGGVIGDTAEFLNLSYASIKKGLDTGDWSDFHGNIAQFGVALAVSAALIIGTTAIAGAISPVLGAVVAATWAAVGVIDGLNHMIILAGKVQKDIANGYWYEKLGAPDWMDPLEAIWDWIPQDPLVLDLDGDGIELTSLATSEAHFDLDGDGFAEHTGWVAPDDGLLVLDQNGNGTIDGIDELFGSPAESAFDELAELDSNGDGLINSQDAQFADLQVWRDLNQDGESDPGELQSLSEAGVESISLETENENTWENGNQIVSTSTITHSDGTTSTAGEVLFDLDQAESVFELPEGFVFDAEAFQLPWLSGFGEVASTPAAFTQDPELKAEAKSLIELARSQGLEAFQPGFEDFLVNWAGVEDTKWLSEAGYVRITYLYDEDKKLEPGFDPLSATPDPDFYIFDVIDDLQFDYDDIDDIAEQHGMVRPDSDYFPSFTIINVLLLDGKPLEEGGVSYLPRPPEIINDGGDGNVDPSNGLTDTGDGFSGDVSKSINLDFNKPIQSFEDPYVPELSAEKFAFLQKIMGRDYARAENSVSHDKIIAGVPEPDIISEMTEQYEAVEDYYQTRFLAQSIQSIILSEGEDADLGFLAPFKHIGYNVFTDALFGDGATFAVEYVTQYTDQGPAAVQKALEHLKGFQAEFSYLPAALADSSLPVTKEQLEAVFDVALEVGTEAADSITVAGNGMLVGKGGDDTLESSGGSKIFLGGAGDDTLKGNSQADTYVYRFGDGNDVISDKSSYKYDDRLVFTDVNVDEAQFSQNAGQDLVITLSNGETVTVTDHFYSFSYDMELIEFSDGTVLGVQEIRDKSVADQKVTGFVRGSGYEETYYHTLGDGSYTISDKGSYSSYIDTLVFMDVNADDVTFSQNAGKDLVITLSNGEAVTIKDHFYSFTYDMELIQFADGTVLDAQAIRDKSVADQKATGSIKGSEYAENYYHSAGDGSYTISDKGSYSSHVDKLVFTDVNAEDVSFSQNGSHDLLITLNSGETVTIKDHFYSDSYDMELIEFADGTVLNQQEIVTKSINDQNGAGDDVVLGSGGADTFHGGAGNDTLNGGHGADTYIYTLGDGNDVIADKSSYNTNDRLVFTNVNVGDVSFSQNGSHDLIISLGNGDTVTVKDHFYSGSYDMELIEFADGTVLSQQEIIAKSINDQNGDGDDLVLGSYSADTFYGGVGNDTLSGGGGADTYIYSIGNGNDVIVDNDAYNRNDRLIFSDVNADDVLFSQNAGQDLVITLSNGETVTVTDHFRSGRYDMELIEFADGTVLGLAEIKEKALLGGSGDDVILGFASDDVISGGAGDDVLTGGAGADEFVFDASTSSGADRITDFELNTDTLTLGGSSYSDLTFVDTGSGTRIEWNTGSVELDGISVTSLTEDQFNFL
ncbi:calcium-binding protein [Ruegeria arenilitoris]|uniref:calcium-binding protein n=1 Tax=Ruegeria arenilitoris TaxID=1173585 RepID=UPI00147FCC7F|nr:calcium-binding protein [Ruegeria arenilitoris]